MAARAHASYDYSYTPASVRPRRQVWLRDDDDDAVVLPRGRSSGITGALIISGVLASALVGGAVFAVYRAAPPPLPVLAETPSAPLHKEWQPDPLFTQATMLRALSQPAQATPATAAVASTSGADENVGEAAEARRAAESPEVFSKDAAPPLQEPLPQPSSPEPVRSEPALTQPMLPDPVVPEEVAPRTEAPYPPVTTPPEMIQPASPEQSGDAENPY